MELQTRLKHIHSEAEFKQILEENAYVMICCGRMGPMCLPVYAATSMQSQEQVESILKAYY